jgi:branched-chain amino acid transport system ATP-binding protein
MTATGGLSIQGLTALREQIPVVRKVDLEVPAGQVTVLLGMNGAGKTTLLDAVSGVIPVTSGKVLLDGAEIHGLRKERRARAGLAYVEQGRSIFPELTVDENLMISARGASILETFELFPELKARRNVPAQLISGGEQQMLVLARAVVSQPKVLLIDEMSQGLAPVIVKRLMPFVASVAQKGIAVLLVEQFAHLALKIGTTGHVMTGGEIVLSGPCAELAETPDKVRRAYLHGKARIDEPAGAEDAWVAQ